MSCNDFYFCTPYSSLYSKHLFGFLLPPPYPVINWSNRERINHATVLCDEYYFFSRKCIFVPRTHMYQASYPYPIPMPTYVLTYLCSVGKSSLNFKGNSHWGRGKRQFGVTFEFSHTYIVPVKSLTITKKYVDQLFCTRLLVYTDSM